MKIKEQWLVLYQNNMQLLVLTENNGYYLGYETTGYCFWKITAIEAKELIEKSKP